MTELLARLLASPQGRIFLLVAIVVVALAWGGWVLWDRWHAPPAPESPPANVSAGSVRIATWNLRKFSERDRAGQHPPDLVAIARIVKEGGIDLLVIQEVQQKGEMVQRLRRQLNEPWRHAVTDRTGNNERYGFLWREDKVRSLDTPRLYAGPEAPTFDRVPAVASFKCAEFDFVLVTAHLWYGDKANNPRRRAEAEALARIAAGLQGAGAERDVIVLGDFNEMRANGNLHLFEARGFVRTNTEPTNLGSSEVFDNILVHPAYTRELVRAGVVRFDETLFGNDDKRAAEDVSDHRPVWADFNTVGPDDD